MSTKFVVTFPFCALTGFLHIETLDYCSSAICGEHRVKKLAPQTLDILYVPSSGLYIDD